MENNFKQESSQIENLLSKATTAIEVVKNSCYYQDNYAEGEILEDAANYLYNIQDILFEQQYKIKYKGIIG